MKIHFFIFAFIILEAYSILPDFKRQELLKKLKRINSINDFLFEPSEETLYTKNLKNNIDYNITIINDILEKYDFPKNFNFLEKHQIKPKVKDQESCGGCWAFASTSALGYRFEKKYGIDINLSPQDGLSCYIKDCSFGGYGIDAQLNLLINGSLTETCFPFVSGEEPEILPDCPSHCNDESVEFKRYYSQNAYTTENMVYDNTEEDFYDFVMIIMDQLLTQGPVVTNIDVYTDFQRWSFDEERCKKDAYAPGPDAEKEKDGHAMVIVGYGFLEDKNKFYWLIQNSWGEDSCDNGFLKIEFGKAGVEQVSFSEAYFPEKEKNKTDVNISFKRIDRQCNLIIETDTETKWNHSLQINFQHQETKDDFNIFCTSYDFPQGNEAKCFFEILNYYKPKGTYVYNSYKSLGNEINFILDDSFKNKDFNFRGWDEVAAYVDNSFQEYFFSDNEFKLVFYYRPDGDDKDLPLIYANVDVENPMRSCEKIFMNDFQRDDHYLIVCDIQQDEMDYFYEFDPDEEGNIQSLMTFEILCSDRDTTFTYAYKIDVNKYTVLQVTNFYYQTEGKLSSGEKLLIYANNIGNKEYTEKKRTFISFIYIETDEAELGYYTMLIQCDFATPQEENSKYKIECYMDINKDESVNFKSVSLLPYMMPYEYKEPFEIKLKDPMKGKVYKQSFGSYTKYNFVYIFLILALLI